MGLLIGSTISFTKEVKADSSGQTAVSEYALSWDGHTEMPYIYGGPGGRSGPMTLEECSEQGVGFDCSAFTAMVYRHFGIEITAQSDAQRSEAYAVYYSEEDAVPGDIAWWEGHVAIYIGDGKIVHTNTSRPPTNYPHVSTFAGEGANYNAPAAYLRMVEDVSDLGTPSNSDQVEENVEEAIGYGSMITESDLTGMPIPSTLSAEQNRIELKDRSSLTKYDIANLEYIKSYLESSNGETTHWYSILTSFIGIVLIFYSVLLLVALFFDRSNQWFDFSLLWFLSFGKYRLVDSYDVRSGLVSTGYDSSSDVIYITTGMVVARSVMVLIVGCLLVSGILGNTIANIVSSIVSGV